MTENRTQQQDRGGKGVAAEKHIPVNEHENTAVPDPPSESSPRWHEPDGVETGIADADKVARTGSTKETVRNTPPAGHWNETSKD